MAKFELQNLYFPLGFTFMKILFAIDGSNCSKIAIAQALDLKCPYGTELKVVSVLDFFEPLPAVEEIKEREIAAARALVDETVEKLKDTHKEAVVTGEVLDGYVVDEILHVSQEWGADLIIMGSHGRTGMAEFWMGSVSRSVLLHARSAVRIVRDKSGDDQPSGGNVLLAVDDSEHCDHLIEHVIAMPWTAKTTFRLVHVVPSINPDMLLDSDTGYANTLSQYCDAKVAGAEIWVRELVGKLNAIYGDNVAESRIVIGDAREEILKQANEWPADLIMLGSHGRRGFERLLMGSVSEAVATHAKCSVEVTRMPARRKPKLHVVK